MRKSTTKIWIFLALQHLVTNVQGCFSKGVAYKNELPIKKGLHIKIFSHSMNRNSYTRSCCHTSQIRAVQLLSKILLPKLHVGEGKYLHGTFNEDSRNSLSCQTPQALCIDAE